MNAFRRTVAALTAICVLGTSVPTVAIAAPAPAPVTTEEALAPAVQERISGLLAREEVRAGLIARGVDPSQVEARIAALTEDEARLLAERLDTLPAGGDSVLGILFAVFVILLVTDILGLTKVFPFTRPVR